jgi:hypothetical protein
MLTSVHIGSVDNLAEPWSPRFPRLAHVAVEIGQGLEAVRVLIIRTMHAGRLNSFCPAPPAPRKGRSAAMRYPERASTRATCAESMLQSQTLNVRAADRCPENIVRAKLNAQALRLAAKILGRVEELLWELADQLEPEKGMLWKDLIAACIRHVTFASLRMT